MIIACTSDTSRNESPGFLSSNSAVASGKSQATDAGIAILEKGGNAVDAAVATAFTLAVVEPSMSGIGGRMQAIVRLADGQIVGIDGTTVVPAAYDTNVVSKEIYGYHVIGVPGVVAGLCTLLETYGTLDLATVMEPAIELATNGFPVGEIESMMHGMVLTQLLEFEGTRKHFLNKDGSTYQPGELLIQPELAQTLTLIAQQGKDVFYKGEIAEKIVADNQKNGGVLSLEDLANYQVLSSKVLHGNYRGFDLHGLWLPSFGAITIEIMNILETVPVQDYSESDWIKAIYASMVLGYADRSKQLQGDSMAALLTSEDYAQQRASEIDATISSLMKNGKLPLKELEDSGHTTNLVTADKNGMMVVLTQSLGPIMGSKVATPGLGFMHAIASGKYLMAFEPGSRTSSHISPVIVEKDGQPFLGVGAAGGDRIVTAITNVISRTIDQQMSISAAVLAPRVFPNPDSIHLEVGTKKSWPDTIVEELRRQSIPVSTRQELTHFGIVHAILFDTLLQQWIPTAEPDWDGSARAIK